MTATEIRQILDEVAAEVDGRVRETYSGRGMYGRECFGIVCTDTSTCIEAAAVHGITGAKTDNMGLQYIVYWPQHKTE